MKKVEHRASSKGFTLVEIMVVIAIIGMMLAVSTYTLRNLTRANLRETAGKTSAAMRFAFDRSLMTGSYIRLAIDMEKGALWLEVSEDRVSLKKGRDQHAVTGADAERQTQEEENIATKPSLPLGMLGGLGGSGEDGEDGEALPAFDVQALIRGYENQMQPVKRSDARFKPLKTIGAKRIKIKSGIQIAAVMTPRLEEPADEGVAYIYFFPQGHAEPGIIHLKNNADEYYSVVMHPLTGQARVYNCRYRIPEEFGKDDLERRKERSFCEDPS